MPSLITNANENVFIENLRFFTFFFGLFGKTLPVKKRPRPGALW
jgi:hypothetical protein